jgi:hypothetical protein
MMGFEAPEYVGRNVSDFHAEPARSLTYFAV